MLRRGPLGHSSTGSNASTSSNDHSPPSSVHSEIHSVSETALPSTEDTSNDLELANQLSPDVLPFPDNITDIDEDDDEKDDQGEVNKEHEGDDTIDDEEETFLFEGKNATELPPAIIDSIHQYRGLRKLSLKENRLKSLPPTLEIMPDLYYLNLGNNEFTEIPDIVYSLKNLEILDLSHNRIRKLSTKLVSLPQLVGLSLVGNELEVLPPVLADLPALEILELADNPIRIPFPLEDFGITDGETYFFQIKKIIKRFKSVLDLAVENEEFESSDQEKPYQRIPERTRSASESGVALRSSKRMGFVMSRNATDQSYVASLHARGLSHDAHMLDSIATEPAKPQLSQEPATAPNSVTGTPVLVPTSLSESAGGSISSTIGSTIGSLQDLYGPDSPVPMTSPRVSPRGSPRSSIDASTDATIPSSGLRLTTLAEEYELGMQPISPLSPTAAGSSLSRNSSVAYHESSLSPQSPPLSPTILAQEPISYALDEFCTTLNEFESVLPPMIRGLFADVQTQLASDQIGEALFILSEVLERITSPPNFASIIDKLSKRQQRKLASAIMLTFPELEAAWRLTQQSSVIPVSANQPQAQDDQLHIQLDVATRRAQSVLSQLNIIIGKSASAAASSDTDASSIVTRVRDLSSVCVRCNNSVKSVRQLLEQQAMVHSRPRELHERRKFWDEVNGFLKAVVATLAAVKSALIDMPLLSESRISMEVADLTRMVKEIPPLLEQSSYWLLLEQEQLSGDLYVHPAVLQQVAYTASGGMTAPPISGMGITPIPGESLQMLFNSQSQVSLPPPTPLTATLGAAAQALVSPSERAERPSEGYIQFGLRSKGLD